MDLLRLVAQELVRNNPYLQGRCRPVPSLQNMSDQERDKYLSGEDLTWDKGKKVRILARIAESGHKIGAMDPDKAFDGVKLVNVSAGEVLIEAGSPPGFVYVALTEGLHGTPLGGYRPFPVYPYTPLGNTGVIRGAARNATIVAERPLSVLMIPKEIYLKEWHDTYSAHEFKELLIQVYREQ
ncbi:cyclic nucleotide-binding domain-containing protein [Chloroflexi bacterium TSY]|nr:cyclic nucleotide-binding domain-containing protein [Chloroflexi bacterium TSY]